MTDNLALIPPSGKSLILYMMLRELRLIKKIPSLMVMIFVYPCLIAIAFFAMYYNGSITQIPIGIIDQDQTQSSRQLIQNIAASPEILVAERYADLAAAKKGLLSNDIYAIVMVPPNFEQQMLANKQPEITAFYNNQYMTVGGTANRALTSSLNNVLSDIQLAKIKQSNIPTSVGQTKLKPLAVDVHASFNPTLSFMLTLINGLFPVILQIIMMLAITVSMHLERQYVPNLNHLRHLSRNNPLLFFINKSCFYIVVFMVPLLIFDVIMMYLFDLPIKGNIFLLLLGNLLFIMATLAVGMMFSLFIPDKLSNYGVVGVITSPAFGFTGLIFPKLAMNSFAYLWSCVLPVTWYIQLRLDQTLRGLNTIDALIPVGNMLLLIFVPLCLIGLYFKLNNKRGYT